MSYDVLVYGPLFCDLIFTELPVMPSLGTETFAGDFTIAIGGSAIVAVALQRLGARVGLIADLGSDPLSKIAYGLMNDLGLDQRLIRQHDYPLAQVTVALSFPQDRAFVTRFEQPQTPVDLAQVLREHPAKHLHVCSFMAVLQTPDAAEIAHSLDMTVSMDPGWDEQALRAPQLQAMINQVDLFLPSKSELCHITRQDDVEQALAQTLSGMMRGIVVMKHGRHGALARTENGTEHVPSLPVDPVDTTGAGDCFDAGFLYVYVQGKPLKTCMHYGVICGALSTTKVGGATAAPTALEVEAWRSKLQ